MKALVLGGNGFIGSHLVDRLIEDGDLVRVFACAPERYRDQLSDVDYRIGQFGDKQALSAALKGIDVVYHLISTTLPATSNLDPAADVSENLLPTIELLNLMVKTGVERIVYFSSGGTVYGNPRTLPINEEHPLNPICSYGVVKIAIEKYLYMYQNLHGLQPIVLRPSNPFGPRQGHEGVQGLIATFLNNVLKQQVLRVWGDGSIIRDYIYVKDLARLCSLAGRSGKNGVFNVGSGLGLSVNQVIENIKNVTGIDAQVRYEPARLFDVKEVVLDISKACKEFDWKPEVSLPDALAIHWHWLNSVHPSLNKK